MKIIDKVYTEYFKIGFKKSVEYKSYLIGVFFNPLFIGLLFYFVWDYIYTRKYELAIKSGEFIGNLSDFTIGGFTFNEMLVYLLIGLLINTTKNNDLSEIISQTIKSGDIAIYLCRPISFVKSILFENLGKKVINFIIIIFLLVSMTYLVNLPYPKNSLIFLIFILYGILMVLFDIILYIIIGGLSFWVVEIWGIKASIEQILWILSGRALPITLFPNWLQSFILFTPFMYLEYTFAKIYLEKLSITQALNAMVIFIFWIFLLLLLMIFIYKKGFKKLEVFGG